VVSSIDEAVDATRRAQPLSRRACRRLFERRFLAERMARDYLELYRTIARPRRGSPALVTEDEVA
jgi:hypothetical protein